jgi:manganese transport protein
MNTTPDDTGRFAELDSKPFVPRVAGYLRFMGPGYLQSAMTLGGGSAFAALFGGAAFGYQLLWVAPTAMLLGIIVMSAVAWQTLSTGEDPYDALKRRVHPVFAWMFAWGGLLSSIIWQFAQYALAGAMIAMLIGTTPLIGGLMSLAWCVSVGLLHGRAPRFIRTYELILTGMVWFIVLSMAAVVIRTGIPNPGEMLTGFIPSVPEDWSGTDANGAPASVDSLTVIVSGLAAAVGANMLFVYPYTLRKNGWGRAHRRLARYDLVFGMFLPFSLAVSLMVIASAAVFHYGDAGFTGAKIAPAKAAEIFADPERLGPVIGKWIFGLGILAMALSSITMQMLASGFAGVKLFGVKEDSPGHKFFIVLPAIGFLGAVFWGDIAPWVAVPTNVICGLFLPVSYLGFTLLQRQRDFLADDTPRGGLAAAWLAGMAIATIVLTVFLATVVVQEGPGFIERLLPGEEQAYHRATEGGMEGHRGFGWCMLEQDGGVAGCDLDRHPPCSSMLSHTNSVALCTLCASVVNSNKANEQATA